MGDNMPYFFPEAFAERMKMLLGEAFSAFTSSYSEDSPVSVRLHPLKWKGDCRVTGFRGAARGITWVSGRCLLLIRGCMGGLLCAGALFDVSGAVMPGGMA